MTSSAPLPRMGKPPLAMHRFSTIGIPATTRKRGLRRNSWCVFVLLSLYDLHRARVVLDAAHREFIRRAVPWARVREPRRKKTATKAEQSSEVPRVANHLTADVVAE